MYLKYRLLTEVAIVIYPYREFILMVINFFGQSLKYGNLYIYESMPRMLSLWLDFGAEMAERERESTKNEVVLQSMRLVLTQANKVSDK